MKLWKELSDWWDKRLYGEFGENKGRKGSISNKEAR